MIFTPSPQPVAAQLADFHVSDDGVGGECGTLMKWDRDWVGVAPDPVSYAWRRCAGRDEEWGNRRMLQP